MFLKYFFNHIFNLDIVRLGIIFNRLKTRNILKRDLGLNFVSDFKDLEYYILILFNNINVILT